jgi:hypothetical protein
MISRKSMLAVLTIASAFMGSTAFAQSCREIIGSVEPFIYDHEGARHFYVYGYYGPYAPSMITAHSDRTVMRNEETASHERSSSDRIKQTPPAAFAHAARTTISAAHRLFIVQLPPRAEDARSSSSHNTSVLPLEQSTRISITGKSPDRETSLRSIDFTPRVDLKIGEPCQRSQCNL